MTACQLQGLSLLLLRMYYQYSVALLHSTRCQVASHKLSVLAAVLAAVLTALLFCAPYVHPDDGDIVSRFISVVPLTLVHLPTLLYPFTIYVSAARVHDPHLKDPSCPFPSPAVRNANPCPTSLPE